MLNGKKYYRTSRQNTKNQENSVFSSHLPMKHMKLDTLSYLLYNKII